MRRSNGSTFLAVLVLVTTAASACDAGDDPDEDPLRDAGGDASTQDWDASPSQACDPGEIDGYYCCNLDVVSDPECTDGTWQCASGSLTNDDPCEKIGEIPGDDAGA